jgi:hypothetical protein
MDEAIGRDVFTICNLDGKISNWRVHPTISQVLSCRSLDVSVMGLAVLFSVSIECKLTLEDYSSGSLRLQESATISRSLNGYFSRSLFKSVLLGPDGKTVRVPNGNTWRSLIQHGLSKPVLSLQHQLMHNK